MFSMSKLSRMETGHGVATPRDIRDLCDLYGVTDEAERERMMKLAAKASSRRGGSPTTWATPPTSDWKPRRWPSPLSSHRWYTASCRPRITRVPVTRAPCLGSVRIRSRCRSRRSSPGSASSREATRLVSRVVLDEAALHRVVGGRQVMAAQLAKILDMSALPNVMVQVLPLRARARTRRWRATSPSSNCQTPTPGVVFVEGLIGSTYLERAEDLKRYREIFNRLQSIALSPKDTADLIANLSPFL